MKDALPNVRVPFAVLVRFVFSSERAVRSFHVTSYFTPRFFSRSLPLYLSILLFFQKSLIAQPSFIVQAGTGGAALHLLSLNAEVPVIKTDEDSFIQSIRLSAEYGLSRFDNVNFIPVESRLVFFHGSNHVELSYGVNFQSGYHVATESEENVLKSSPLNPILTVAYRYEQDDGGFSFRFVAGGFSHIAENKWIYVAGVYFGHAF